jgi:metacaspase-1
MAQGYSIHIGLNHVDTSSPAYQGYNIPELSGCINDADAMERLASGLGYSEITKLTDAQATASAVLGAISNAADNLGSGDILLLTYSGHGSQVPDRNGDEIDGLDETWVLYDRMLVDDELALQWKSFKSGARIFMISDSCHSGTVDKDFYNPQYVRALRNRGVTKARTLRRLEGRLDEPGSPQQIAAARLEQYHRGVMYLPVVRDADIGASVILISGCMDNQTSQDGNLNGLFTEHLLKVWNKGFQGNYKQFATAIAQSIGDPTQSPNYDTAGARNAAFEAQRPFTIDGASTPGGQPRITGPASISRGDSPPQFDVDPGGNSYYAVELASSTDLLASANGRSDSNYHASWSDSSSLLASSPYTLPDAVWQQLSGNDQLYYRVWTSSSSDSWANEQVSTSDADIAQAPSLQISGDRAVRGDGAGTRDLAGADVSGAWS